MSAASDAADAIPFAEPAAALIHRILFMKKASRTASAEESGHPA